MNNENAAKTRYEDLEEILGRLDQWNGNPNGVYMVSGFTANAQDIPSRITSSLIADHVMNMCLNHIKWHIKDALKLEHIEDLKKGYMLAVDHLGSVVTLDPHDYDYRGKVILGVVFFDLRRKYWFNYNSPKNLPIHKAKSQIISHIDKFDISLCSNKDNVIEVYDLLKNKGIPYRGKTSFSYDCFSPVIKLQKDLEEMASEAAQH